MVGEKTCVRLCFVESCRVRVGLESIGGPVETAGVVWSGRGGREVGFELILGILGHAEQR